VLTFLADRGEAITLRLVFCLAPLGRGLAALGGKLPALRFCCFSCCSMILMLLLI
jgi:hypothetical protein